MRKNITWDKREVKGKQYLLPHFLIIRRPLGRISCGEGNGIFRNFRVNPNFFQIAVMDIFQKKNARTLLQGKKILFIGDSVLRSIYQVAFF